MGTVDEWVGHQFRGGADLRQRAEEIAARDRPRAEPPRGVAVGDVVYELRVHEIELVMQNEELRRNAEELARARDTYRAMYDDAPVAYLTLDHRGIVVEGNHVAAAMLAVPRHALAHIPLPSLMDQADGDAFYLHLREVAELGGHRRCDLVLHTTDRRRLNVRLDTVAAGAANLVRFRTTLIDVTDQHRVDQEIRQLNADLEWRVAERTAELRTAHERLLEARKMEALGRVASEIAHDFNNLLTVIRLELELLRRADHAPQAHDGLGQAIVATTSAGALIAKLLAFARRDADGGGSCAPAAALTASRTLLKQLVTGDVELELRAEPDLGRIDLDETTFEQILTNLVVNASDAIVGAGRISVDLRHGDAGVGAVDADDPRAGAHVVLTVRDTGCGMDAETLSHACEPFFTTKGRSRGTGFGLAIVYGAVNAAGGRLELRSEPGVGTTVIITLPRSHASPESHQPVIEDEWPGGDETVLVVDDDDDVRRATSRVLASAGYDVVTAATGHEALAMLAAQPAIAAVVSDIIMPEMSGVDLARQLGALRPELPLVLISGSVFDENTASTWRLVRKPYTPIGLLQAVRDVLTRGGEPLAATEPPQPGQPAEPGQLAEPGQRGQPGPRPREPIS